jgi:hypothetical protein
MDRALFLASSLAWMWLGRQKKAVATEAEELRTAMAVEDPQVQRMQQGH